MQKTNTKIGDVFSVEINGKKKYFQHIANDQTQLNSNVIRAFKGVYPINAEPILSEIINDDVEFYAHCIIKLGIKMNLWKNIGNVNQVGDLENILFRGASDSGSKPGEQVKISTNWYVWKINDKNFTRVGKLNGEIRNADLGLVVNPYDVIERMGTGKYSFFYPSFD